MKAGWQLILTTVVSNTTALTERIRGDYIADDFSDYSIQYSIVTSDLTAKDPYKTRTFYSDDGNTVIGTSTGNLAEYARGVGPFVYDAMIKTTPIDLQGRNVVNKNYVGFVDSFSDLNVYYAQLAQINIRCSNLWMPIVLKAVNSNMYWVFTGLDSNFTLNIKAKEVTP